MAASAPRAASITQDEWQRVKDHFINLHITQKKPLREVVILLERDLGFRATEQQYKKQITRWGLRKYKKRNKRSHLQSAATPASANASPAPSSEVETDDHFSPNDVSAAASGDEAQWRQEEVAGLPRFDGRPLADAQHDNATTTADLSTPAARSTSDLAATQSPIPSSNEVWPDYWHREIFDSSNLVHGESTSAPGLDVLPAIWNSYSELEVMGATMSAEASMSPAEHATDAATQIGPEQSFESSNKSSGGTIDSTPASEHDLVEGERLRELFRSAT